MQNELAKNVDYQKFKEGIDQKLENDVFQDGSLSSQSDRQNVVLEANEVITNMITMKHLQAETCGCNDCAKQARSLKTWDFAARRHNIVFERDDARELLREAA